MMKGHYGDSMYVSPTTDTEIIDIIKNLKKSAPGYDGINASLLKHMLPAIINPPLTHMINLSILNGQVPDELKIAKVIPIFKGGDVREISNYKPVSVLPVV